MAPWCFNECFRKGLVAGDLVMYLCDDDILYSNAFATFVDYSSRNPQAEAMYASQDIGVILPNGQRLITGERRATQVGGRCVGGRLMDALQKLVIKIPRNGRAGSKFMPSVY